MEDISAAWEASMRVLLAPSKSIATPSPAKLKIISMGPTVEPAAEAEAAHGMADSHPLEAATEEQQDEADPQENAHGEAALNVQGADAPELPVVELTLELGSAAEEDGWAGRESGYEAFWEEPVLPPLLSEQTQRIEALLRSADIDVERKELALNPARRASVIAKRALEVAAADYAAVALALRDHAELRFADNEPGLAAILRMPLLG